MFPSPDDTYSMKLIDKWQNRFVSKFPFKKCIFFKSFSIFQKAIKTFLSLNYPVILPLHETLNRTMWVASPWGFSEMTIQPARHEYHACCLLRAGFLAFQPVVDNTRGTRVEQVASSFQKILSGSQLTWYNIHILRTQPSREPNRRSACFIGTGMSVIVLNQTRAKVNLSPPEPGRA